MPTAPNMSKLLEMAIKRYQFDVVGWTKFCKENKTAEKKALPPVQPETLELLRIQDKLSVSISAPPVKKIFSSKEAYKNWLKEEYQRDEAFYEAVLKNPGKYSVDPDDTTLNEEINTSAKKYLNTIKNRRAEEETHINGITDEQWNELRVSKYPKVLLGLLLGASEEDIINNFGLYFINLLKAHFSGSRVLFLSSSGPEYWHELDKCKKELDYFKEEVIRPSLELIHKDKEE